MDSNKSNMKFYGKREAQMIAGIAIILMVTHHVFGFCEYRLPDNSFWEPIVIRGISIERMLAAFGKICVSIFAFSSGYAIWIRTSDYNSFRSVTIRIFKFLLNYWIILGLFLIYAISIGDKIPIGQDLVMNMIGLHTAPSYPYVNVAFAWYVAFYICLLLFAPLILFIFKRNNFIFDILVFSIISIGISYVCQKPWHLDFLSPFPQAIFGAIVAKWNIFEFLYKKFENTSIWIYVIFMFVIMILRQSLILLNIPQMGGIESLITLTTIYILIFIINKLRSNLLEKALVILGTFSMNIWFLHGIFFTGECHLQKIIYYPYISIFILIWCFVILLPVSIGCTYLQKYILKNFMTLRYTFKRCFQ